MATRFGHSVQYGIYTVANRVARSASSVCAPTFTFCCQASVPHAPRDLVRANGCRRFR